MTTASDGERAHQVTWCDKKKHRPTTDDELREDPGCFRAGEYGQLHALITPDHREDNGGNLALVYVARAVSTLDDFLEWHRRVGEELRHMPRTRPA